MFKLYYEDIEVGRTETFGNYPVTRDEIIDFATKYDPQPFHIDEAAAKKSVFGGLCASGWHTCAMTMRMMVDHLQEQGLASLGSPGIDEIRWLKPVFPGQTLSVTNTITSKRLMKSRPGVGLLKGDYVVKPHEGEPVMTFKSNYMVAQRPK